MTVALTLQRAGRWDDALALAESPAQRAEILVDRHIWRLDDPAEAFAATEVVEPALAILLQSQLRYWNELFKFHPSDGADPIDGFAEAAKEPRLAGWATFWHAVATENLRDDPDAAAPGYERARESAVASGDRLLESYAVRHIGYLRVARDRPAGVLMLRRSLQLRAACGARPHVTAAQVLLAETLGAGAPEAAELLAIARDTAVELGLTWLLPESPAA
jgi:hypothetical protein